MIMVIKKYATILFLIVFFVASSYLVYPCPKNCPHCWLKFKNSPTNINLTMKKTSTGTYMISLGNLKTEIEKARIGDKLIVELKLGNRKIIKLGSFSPRIISRGTTLLEKYNSMGNVSYQLPKGMKLIPTSAQLIVRDASGKFKSTKLVQLRITP